MNVEIHQHMFIVGEIISSDTHTDKKNHYNQTINKNDFLAKN